MTKPANTARPQRFAIHGEYAVACESLGSNNVARACPGDLTDGPSASGVRTRWANTSGKSDMPNDPNPYESPKGVTFIREDRSAKPLSEGEQLEQNAIHLFASGVIGLFAPACAVYGIVFLLRHKHQFPRKRLAIIGTVLHCLWSSIWCYWIFFD
jgi:hypothetical protein